MLVVTKDKAIYAGPKIDNATSQYGQYQLINESPYILENPLSWSDFTFNYHQTFLRNQVFILYHINFHHGKQNFDKP